MKKGLRGLFTLIGIGIGYIIGEALVNNSELGFLSYFRQTTGLTIVFVVLSMIIFGLIMLLISPWINSGIFKLMDRLEKNIQTLSANEMLFGIAGAIVGLVISSFFVSIFVGMKNIVWTGVALLISIFMAVLGADIAIKKKEELINMFSSLKRINNKDKKNKNISRGDPKVLDTSVIIDGRIFDICQTGFIEGALVIPNFVLEELRHIADSSDALKRNRGRRGLDILNKIQNELNIEVQITEKDFPEIAEVDSKLLKLAQILNGKVITNDYNLNKVAKFQGVPVLNINELANAVKPVVLPGEEMTIQIIKDGKESGQGIAYLDDGTMIVVEGARRHIGEIMDVVVTSVLQTAAGRMIFARQKDEMEQAE